MKSDKPVFRLLTSDFILRIIFIAKNSEQKANVYIELQRPVAGCGEASRNGNH